jgi:site-specific DNA recombinase
VKRGVAALVNAPRVQLVLRSSSSTSTPCGRAWAPRGHFGAAACDWRIRPLYIGDIVWNKFRWERNPETGKRVPRLRPREEWIVQHDESLRIVPQELWERVKQRQRDAARKTAGQTYRGGRYPKYLFSGLLKCGLCGPNYVLRNGAEYG